MKRGFKKHCEDRAIEFRNKLGLKAHDQLSTMSLAHHLGITVLSPEDIPGLDERSIEHLVYHDPYSWSAVTLMIYEHALIISNSRHSPGRHEANVMHELSHVILKHSPTKITPLPGFPFPIREYPSDDEDEAKWLGGCLQIPRAGLLWALKRNMPESKIAEHFGSSPDMVQYRRNVTGVDKQFKRL